MSAHLLCIYIYMYIYNAHVLREIYLCICETCMTLPHAWWLLPPCWAITGSSLGTEMRNGRGTSGPDGSLGLGACIAAYSWEALSVLVAVPKNFCKLQLDHSSNFHNSGRAIHKHLSQTLEDSWAPNIAGFLKAEGFGVKLYTCSTPSTTKTCVRDGGVADAELKRVTAAAWAITSSNEWTPPNVLNYYSTLMASAKSLQSVLQVDYP
jgi:hypothetical protein